MGQEQFNYEKLKQILQSDVEAAALYYMDHLKKKMDYVYISYVGGGPKDGTQERVSKDTFVKSGTTHTFTGSFPASGKAFVHKYGYTAGANTNMWGWVYTYTYLGTFDV